MIAHVLALVLASNASGKTLVRAQPGTIVPATAKAKTILRDEPGMVMHTYWTATGVQDTKGFAWAQQGAVPLVSAVPPLPYGAGPHDASNHYYASNPTAISALTGNWTCRVVFAGAASGTFVDPLALGNGYVAAQNRSSSSRVEIWGSAMGPATANAVLTTATNVLSFGVSGTTMYAKLNGGTTASAAKPSAGGWTNSVIGESGAFDQNFPATVYELSCAPAAFTEADEVDAHASVKAKLGITAW